MRKLRWLMVYLGLAIFGCVGETLIGMFHTAVFGYALWIYYNGFYTSVESFFYFGIAGTIGFKMFLMLMKYKGYKIVRMGE